MEKLLDPMASEELGLGVAKMTFRFHSLFLYTLPGVVVLLGYWWYVSQRRRRLSWQVEEVTGVGVTAGLVKSPAEREESLVEQEALLKSYVTMFAKPQEQLEEGLVDPQNEVFEVFLSAGAIEGPNEVRIQRRTASSAERPEPEGKVTEGLWAEMDNVDVSLEGPKLKLSCLEESRGSCSSSPACVELYNVETGSAWLPEECNTSEPEGQLQQSNVTKPCAADMETQPSNAAYFSVGKQGYMDNSVRMVGDTDGKCCEESCLSDRLMEENHFAGSVDMADFHFYSNTHSACPPNRSLADLVEWEIQVPNRLVGRLIGKKGRSVNFLKRRSGAKIYVFNATQDLQVCHIEGSKAQVDRALALIGKKFSELDLTNQRLALGHHLLPEAWMRLPEGELARVIVVKVVSPSQMFIQWNESTIQRALHSLEERMTWCYSQPEASPRPARAQRKQAFPPAWNPVIVGCL
ncbi:A-kinase anchor protein 1, mitochondrial-like [Arapaima gigas]